MNRRNYIKYIDLTPLLEAIEIYHLNSIWGDTLFECDSEVRIQEKKQEAIESYERMMRSPKNDGSQGYRQWAINKSLGLHSLNKRVHSATVKKHSKGRLQRKKF